MPAFIDRTGMRYGRLTVIRRANKPGKTSWECLCDCGGTVVAQGTNLVTGNTSSCGCVWGSAVRGYMIGRSFGRLTVISQAASMRIGKSVFAAYQCKCSYGGTIETLGMSLRNGDTASCGCAYADAGKARSLESTVKRIRLRQANARRHAAVRAATKPFDLEFFRLVMREARSLARERYVATGVPHDVDHVVPLRSPAVCGLNNEFNLAVIPSAINRRKRNRYWPDMPEGAACSK